MWKLINFGRGRDWRDPGARGIVYHGINIGSCGDNLIITDFPPGPTMGPSRPWSLSRPAPRLPSLVSLCPYLLISHRCVVNFPSLALIHAGITDLRLRKYLFSARRKDIKVSMSVLLTWYWGLATVSGRGLVLVCLDTPMEGITCLSSWGLLAPLDRAVEFVPASLKITTVLTSSLVSSKLKCQCEEELGSDY